MHKKTLELSRVIDQGFARHGLSALVKRYNVPWDEDAHHRADYDAEGTALVFHKMIEKLTSQNLKKISDLENFSTKSESDFLLEISLSFFLDIFLIDKIVFLKYNNVDASVY